MTTWITRNGGRVALTAAMLACAGVLGQSFWDYYMNAPWTRDGRVSADSVRIAPQVSGTIESVDVADNDFVVFQALHTGTGVVTSWYVDLTDSRSGAVRFDEFSLGPPVR